MLDGVAERRCEGALEVMFLFLLVRHQTGCIEENDLGLVLDASGLGKTAGCVHFAGSRTYLKKNKNIIPIGKTN